MLTRINCGLALLLGMLSAGCNDILGNELHGVDLDATVEGGTITDGAASDGAPLADGRPSMGAAGSDGSAKDSPASDTVSGAGLRDGSARATAGQKGDAEFEGPSEPDAAEEPDSTGTVTPPACVGGGACAPNDCQNGTWACTDAGRVCRETTPVADGTPCGAGGGDAGGHVCGAGQCVECNAGGDCSAPNTPCVKKSYSCGSGVAVCAVAGNLADGTSCGTGLYCNGGDCAACEVGSACPPAGNSCHVGKITACEGGVATCSDQNTDAAAGTSCLAAGGATGVCNGSGSCVACSAGTQCSPGGSMCSVGVQSCSGGPACQNAVPVDEGQSCGSGQICHNGACTACDATSCSAGCCDSHGCITAQTPTECGTGTGGAACKACAAPNSGTGSAACNGNACTIACVGATPDACNGACVSLKNDDNNCGTCGHVCSPVSAGGSSHCDGNGNCKCTPNPSPCAGAVCGQAPDGCGNMVACLPGCTAPETCSGAGTCTNTMCPGSCPMGFTCGSLSTLGCTTLSCGGCTAPYTCSTTTTPGTCQCTPKTIAQACAGQQCGSAMDGCNGIVTCPNTCTEPYICSGTTCQCTPKTTAQACAGQQCGSAMDGCNGTVTCPNTCTGLSVCSGTTCTCQAGTVSCSGTCVNTSNDPHNCGSCGHACPGASRGETCANGVCQPYLLTSATAPFALATDGVRVYYLYTDGNGVELASVPVAGGNATAAVAATGAMCIGTDGTDVYFAGYNSNSPSGSGPGFLSLAPVGTLSAVSPVIPVANVQDVVSPLFVDTLTNSIFAYVQSGGIWQEQLRTANAPGLVSGFGNGAEPTRIVADATQVYWASMGFGSNGVYAQPIGVAPTGTNYTTLASSANMNAVGLALQGGNIYYADAAGGSVSRVSTSAVTSPTQLATASSPVDLVADLSNVYWIDGSGATIMKVPTTGGAATQFASGGNANAIAQDAASVYWTNSSGIMRAPK
ncbi:MAG: hypothetical protein WBY94_22045 [Polyangiaceae bacterium]